MNLFSLFWAELRRSWLLMISYRFDTLAVLALWLLAFPLMMAVFDSVAGGYGPEQRMASLLGFLVWDLCMGVLSSTTAEVQRESRQGTLELIILAPHHPLIMFTLRIAATFVVKALLTTGMGVILMLLLRLPLPDFSFQAFLIIILTVLGVGGSSLALGGVALVYKHTSSVVSLAALLAVLFTGALVPLNALGPVFVLLRWFAPTAWGIDALRATLLHGATFAALWQDGTWAGLFIQTAILVGVGGYVLMKGFRLARQHGSLGAY